MPMPTESPLPFGHGLDDEHWLQHAREALEPGSWDRIGEFRILGEVSRGGQGVVLKAEAADGHVVAIKRLLAGTLTGTRGRLRLEREMEIAARLDHPGIVRLQRLAYVERQPILVMEWIDGVDPLAWARPTGSPPRAAKEIVTLLIAVCRAIGHAHQRGVIHRDLKPSNLLVDDADIVHVLDFGIAKVLMEEGTADVALTRSTDFLGSPAFAPPERLRDPAPAADVRDDIYGIGAIAYVLLSGHEPYELGTTLISAIRAMEEQRPQELRRLAPDIPRDLALIVHKAIDRERERRYPSVEALAEDLVRFREGRPILARKPSRLYLLRKAVTRRPLVSLLSAAILLLGTGFGFHAWTQAGSIRKERDLARQALAYVTEDVLPLLDPAVQGGARSIPQILEQASATVGKRFEQDPELERELRLALARVQWQQGQPAGARRNLEQALAATPVAWSLQAEGEALLLLAQAQLQMADNQQAERSLAAFDRLVGSGDRGLPQSSLDRRQGIAAQLLFQGGQQDAGLAALQALRAAQTSRGEEQAARTNGRREIAMLRQSGNIEAAIALGRDLLDQLQEQDPLEQNPETAAAFREWGWSLFHGGHIQEAEAPLQHALALRTELLGERHPDTAQSLVDLATWEQFHAWQDASAADLMTIRKRLEQAVAILRRAGGGHHQALADALLSLGGFAEQEQDLPAAIALYRDALNLLEERVGPQHPLLRETLVALGQVQSDAGNTDTARQSLLRAATFIKPGESDSHGSEAYLWMAQAQNEERAGDEKLALHLYHRAAARLEQRFPDGCPPLETCRQRIAALSPVQSPLLAD